MQRNAVVIATHAAQRNAAQCSTMQHKRNAVAKKKFENTCIFQIFVVYCSVEFEVAEI